MVRRIALTASIVLALFGLVACGGGDETTTTTATSAETGATGATGATGVNAEESQAEVSARAEELGLPESISGDQDYQFAVEQLIGSNDLVWEEFVEGAGEEWASPDDLFVYGEGDDPDGPDCGGEPSGAQNAIYCRADGNGFIAWDEPGLIYPFYEDIGEPAVAFVLTHEYAHLVQDRLGLIEEFPLPVEKELNADCLTGAFFGIFQMAGLDITKQESQQLLEGISVVGDQPGTPWQDVHAHGTAEERIEVFDFGLRSQDPTACLEEYGPGFSG